MAKINKHLENAKKKGRKKGANDSIVTCPSIRKTHAICNFATFYCLMWTGNPCSCGLCKRVTGNFASSAVGLLNHSGCEGKFSLTYSHPCWFHVSDSFHHIFVWTGNRLLFTLFVYRFLEAKDKNKFGNEAPSACEIDKIVLKAELFWSRCIIIVDSFL